MATLCPFRSGCSVPVFAPGYGFLYLVAKPVLIALLGGMTFGWEWLTKPWPPGRKR
jgi:hypothetical protein